MGVQPLEFFLLDELLVPSLADKTFFGVNHDQQSLRFVACQVLGCSPPSTILGLRNLISTHSNPSQSSVSFLFCPSWIKMLATLKVKRSSIFLYSKYFLESSLLKYRPLSITMSCGITYLLTTSSQRSCDTRLVVILANGLASIQIVN